MKIYYFSDTHGMHAEWAKKHPLPEADVIVFTGDMSGRGYKYEISQFLDWFSDLPYEYKIFIAGNHDFGFDNGDKEDVLAMIPDNVIYLNDSGVEIEGIKFWGSPIQPEFNNWAFNRKRGDEIKEHWDMIPDDTQVLLTHGPPFGILDYVPRSDLQVGCQDLLMAIKLRLKDLRVHAFGHIHEGAGIKSMDGITYINGSILDEYYQIKHPGHLIDIL